MRTLAVRSRCAGSPQRLMVGNAPYAGHDLAQRKRSTSGSASAATSASR